MTQEEIEERLTMSEKLRMIAPFILLGSTLVFWALPIAIGMINSTSKTTRLNLTMKKQISFDDRIERLKKDLQRTADIHGKFLDDLRPKQPHRWTCDEMGEPGGNAIEVKARVRYMGRVAPLPFEE